jgi:alkylhydroperoxidase family enzyme
MVRIEMLSLEESLQRAAELGISERLASLNIFRVLLRSPRPAKALADLLLELLAGRALDHRLRELVIMRIGWSTGSEYEWTQHWQIAKDLFGLGPDDLLSVRDWQQADAFGPAERAVLAATDETLATGAVSAATAGECAALLGEEGLVELVLAIGAWTAIAQLTRSLRIPLEEGVEPWPPDGAVPP